VKILRNVKILWDEVDDDGRATNEVQFEVAETDPVYAEVLSWFSDGWTNCYFASYIVEVPDDYVVPLARLHPGGPGMSTYGQRLAAISAAHAETDARHPEAGDACRDERHETHRQTLVDAIGTDDLDDHEARTVAEIAGMHPRTVAEIAALLDRARGDR
jgi:hypothetical protein